MSKNTFNIPYLFNPGILAGRLPNHVLKKLHTHPGALAVFVIWVTIPYNLEDEFQFNEYNNPNYPPKNSCFEFTYTTYDGRIVSNPVFVDKGMEGTVTMFPSTMTHCVYPFFTSDKERISIAGNIYEERE